MAEAGGEVDRLLREAGDNDRGFFERVFRTPAETYRRRLAGVGFEGLDHVVDAGCGFGQWTLELARLNRRVTAVDVDPLRTAVTRALAEQHGLAGVQVHTGSITELPVADGAADAVWCYGVIFIADYRRALREFARVLRPGGRLYLTANGPGWYLHYFVRSPNRTPDFSPRRRVLQSLVSTARYAVAGRPPRAGEIIIPSGRMRRDLQACGFTEVRVAADGELSGGQAFFAGRRFGLEAVYEVLCRRSPAS